MYQKHWIFFHLVSLDQEAPVLTIRLIKEVSPRLYEGGSGVRILNACVMILFVVSVIWSVWVHESFCGLYCFNLWCVSGAIFWDLWWFLIFLYFPCYNPGTCSVLRRLSKIVECFFGTHWLGIAGSKGSNGLGASTWRRKRGQFTITYVLNNFGRYV